jgi:hypothetical protein
MTALVSTTTAPPVDPRDVDATLQAVRLQLFRENIGGALDLVDAAHAKHPDPRYAEQAARIRGWLTHLGSREAYLAAQDEQYQRLRWKAGFKLLEKRIRIWLGRKTRKMVERRGRNPEFIELEKEITAVAPKRVLDAGCGEGAVAMAVAARHPGARVDGVEASPANVRLANQLRRSRTSPSARASPRKCISPSRPASSISSTRSRCSSTCATWTRPSRPS